MPILNRGNQLPPHARRLINNYGDYSIQAILVGRAPVQSAIAKIADIITLGAFSKAKERLGYDDIYHLYAIMQLTSPDNTETIYIKTQKNEVVDIKQLQQKAFTDLSDKAESVRVIELKAPILFKDWMDNTAKFMQDRLYHYDPADANCQDFILSSLRANNLKVPASLKSWISQDAWSLLGNNQIINKALISITDLASMANVAIEGEGLGQDILKFINDLIAKVVPSSGTHKYTDKDWIRLARESENSQRTANQFWSLFGKGMDNNIQGLPPAKKKRPSTRL